jgi:hypothetical protein
MGVHERIYRRKQLLFITPLHAFRDGGMLSSDEDAQHVGDLPEHGKW